MTQKRDWTEVLDDANEAKAQRFAAEAEDLLTYLEDRGLTELEACLVMRIAVRVLAVEPEQ